MINYKNIIKHSSIYAFGQILSRCMSFALLPLYTSHLSPVDYGCIAIVDLTIAMVGILVSGGINSAINRHHFEAEEEAGRDAVWWTGLSMAGALTVLGTAPLLLAAPAFERILLGAQGRGGVYLALAIPTLWLNVVIGILDNHLRVQRRSTLSVALALGRLLFNVGLNVTFLVALGMGPLGVFLGNLIAAAAMALALGVTFLAGRGPIRLDRGVGGDLWRFSRPLVATSLLSVVMHQSDRYVLRMFSGTDAVGIYAVAYAIGQALNSLLLMPFATIWRVEIFEIAGLSDARRAFGRVFEYATYAVMLAALALSLLARPLIGIMADESYAAAAGLIPVISLAYVLFSLHEHFKVPAILAKRTVSLLPAFVAGSAVNVGLNLALIPWFGPAGAAWSTVATFATFSAVGLWRYRRIDRYEYPILRIGSVLVGMVATYVLYEIARESRLSVFVLVVFCLASWLAWVVWLASPILPKLWVIVCARSLPAEGRASAGMTPVRHPGSQVITSNVEL
jgi:O-antigen/teichoic acid export membrane protein